MELRNILILLWKIRKIFLSVFFLVFIVVVFGALMITPWYQVGAKVLLRKPLVMASILEQLEFGYIDITPLDDTARANHVSLATIRSVAEKVVEDLDLKRKRYRYQLADLIPFSGNIVSMLGLDGQDMYKQLSVKELTSSSILAKIFPRPGVTISQYEDTDILDIDAKSTDVDEAVHIANAFSKEFVNAEEKRLQKEIIDAEKFIDQALARVKKQYLEHTEILNSFLVNHKILDVDTLKSTLEENILSLENSMRSNKLSQAQVDHAIEKIQFQIKAFPLYRKSSEQESVNSLFTKKESTLLGYYISLAEALAEYTPQHPTVIVLREKIAELERTVPKLHQQIKDNQTIELNSVVTEFEDAFVGKKIDKMDYEINETLYPAQMAQYENRLVELTKISSELAELNRQEVAVDDLYTSLLKLKNLLGAVKLRMPSTITIIEPALKPNSSEISKSKKPSIKMFVILATMLGGFLATGSALLTAYLRDTIGSVRDFKAYPNISVLGIVEKLSRKNRKINLNSSLQKNDFSHNEGIRVTRHFLNQIQAKKNDSTIRCLTISSITQGEGKSLIAAALAVSSARSGKKVLLVDCNGNKHGLVSILSLKNREGLLDILQGDVMDTEVRQETNVSGLTFLSHGIASKYDEFSIESNMMSELLQTWQKEFEMVILDAPATGISADAAILGVWSDGLLLVVEDDNIRRDLFLETSLFLRQFNVKIVGVVFNKVQTMLSAI